MAVPLPNPLPNAPPTPEQIAAMSEAMQQIYHIGNLTPLVSIDRFFHGMGMRVYDREAKHMQAVTDVGAVPHEELFKLQCFYDFPLMNQFSAIRELCVGQERFISADHAGIIYVRLTETMLRGNLGPAGDNPTPEVFEAMVDARAADTYDTWRRLGFTDEDGATANIAHIGATVEVVLLYHLGLLETDE